MYYSGAELDYHLWVHHGESLRAEPTAGFFFSSSSASSTIATLGGLSTSIPAEGYRNVYDSSLCRTNSDARRPMPYGGKKNDDSTFQSHHRSLQLPNTSGDTAHPSLPSTHIFETAAAIELRAAFAAAADDVLDRMVHIFAGTVKNSGKHSKHAHHHQIDAAGERDHEMDAQAHTKGSSTSDRTSRVCNIIVLVDGANLVLTGAQHTENYLIHQNNKRIHQEKTQNRLRSSTTDDRNIEHVSAASSKISITGNKCVKEDVSKHAAVPDADNNRGGEYRQRVGNASTHFAPPPPKFSVFDESPDHQLALLSRCFSRARIEVIVVHELMASLSALALDVLATAAEAGLSHTSPVSHKEIQVQAHTCPNHEEVGGEAEKDDGGGAATLNLIAVRQGPQAGDWMILNFLARLVGSLTQPTDCRLGDDTGNRGYDGRRDRRWLSGTPRFVVCTEDRHLRRVCQERHPRGCVKGCRHAGLAPTLQRIIDEFDQSL